MTSVAISLLYVLIGAPPAQDGWIRPSDAPDAQPIWGVEGGIRVALWPVGDPRGLLRICAPYLDNPPEQVINFIAVEPIVRGRRGYSELEKSRIDGKPGKMMWTTDELPPGDISRPARGKLVKIDGAEAMSFYVIVEPLDNGSKPIIQIILRKDRPHEIAMRVFTAPGGERMEACIFSATMGNYARLRQIHLKDAIARPAELWPGFDVKDPRGQGFTRHAEWGVDRMTVRDGVAVVSATPDEADPSSATYVAGTPEWWKYKGKVAMQFWPSAAVKELVVRVNGRRVYWGSTSDIPGGVAFENFEMQASFQLGQEFVFGVEPVAEGAR